MSVSGCGGDDLGAGNDETAGSETATDTSGDEVGEETSDSGGDGDGDGDGGDGDGDGGCVIGSEGCPCTMGGGCDPGLLCETGVCTPDGSGDGDGDGGDGDGGDGDGDGGDGDGDGDGDPGTTCVDDQSFLIEAEDADTIEGWFETMSDLGEETVLAWNNNNPDASVTWNLDIPCDDTWHIWVRAINSGNDDSFFATVDGGPDPAPIFEIACDAGPNQATYEWRELNWRDGQPCEYLEDPWTQDWAAGAHTFTLSYRESYAISKLWITNTDQPPP